MANLKDTIVLGSLRATDTLYTTKLQTTRLVQAGTFTANTAQEAEADVVAASGAGSIYLYSQASTDGARGIYGLNAAGTSAQILGVDQSNQINGLATITASPTITGTLTLNKNTASTSIDTGTLIVTGGVGVSGRVSADNFNGLTLTPQTTGFTVAGGTTSKTLTVNENYTLAAACAKAVDTSIGAASTSTNLPTSAAVATFVEGKSYLTSSSNLDATKLTGTIAAARLPAVSTTTQGAMAATDKAKLDAMPPIFYGTCTTAAATTEKDVTCDTFTASDLVRGAMIYVTFTATNSGSVSSLKLNVNDTGAKAIKKIYNAAVANLAAAGEIRANETYLFIYNGSQWVLQGTDYNNTYTIANNYLGANGANYVANSALYRYQLLVHTDEDKLTPFNNVSNGAANTGKAILTNIEFDPFDDIFYYNSTTTVAANKAIRADYLYYTYSSVILGYSFNITEEVNALTAAKNVYLQVSPQTNGKVKLASAHPITQTLPATNDGYWYILLGRAVSETNICLFRDHPIYFYDGTAIRQKQSNEITYGTRVEHSVTSFNVTAATYSVSQYGTAVHLQYASDAAALFTYDKILFTLPEAVRPVKTQFIMAFCGTRSDTRVGYALVKVDTSGEVSMNQWSGLMHAGGSDRADSEGTTSIYINGWYEL